MMEICALPAYWVREIGESDWIEVAKSAYLNALTIPEMDTKTTDIYEDELNPLYGFDVEKQIENNKPKL